MGIFISCCKDSTDVVTPDMEVRRQQQVQAAEKRIKAQESRGIKDPERVKRMQERSDAIEKRKEESKKHDSSSGLKWQVN